MNIAQTATKNALFTPLNDRQTVRVRGQRNTIFTFFLLTYQRNW
ncbi:MAG: hypothetical protein JWP32_2417 [Schumannella sp.]|nr:hypothetical protein [Schumannella sp.]